MINIFKSINKKNTCYQCHGKIQIDHSPTFSEICDFCNHKGYTHRKLFFVFGEFNFEASSYYRHGPLRKTHKWNVEVGQEMVVTQEYIDDTKARGFYFPYKAGDIIGYHLYSYDASGKSLLFALKKALNNLLVSHIAYLMHLKKGSHR